MPPVPDSYIRTGVYCIRNKTNNKRYVGSAASGLYKRKREHFNCLLEGKHPNNHLQSAWDLYGAESFEFVVLERCLPEFCVCREQFWIDYHRAANRQFGYNKSPTAGSPLGVKHSDEYCKAVSERNRNRGPETRAKIGASSKGRKHTEEFKREQSERSKKLWQDQEHRSKVISANTGKKRTDEVKLKMSLANLGRHHTEEARRKMSESRKGHKQSPGTIAKRAASLTGKKRTPEQCANISNSLKGKKHTEQARENMSRGQKARFSKPEELEKLKKVNLGRVLTDEHKRKISEAQRRPGVYEKKVLAAKKQALLRRAKADGIITGW